MSASSQSDSSTITPEWLAVVREKVESLRYGVVQIVVHDRKVTQIERTERTRLEGSTQIPEAPGRR